jgi:hypothetical protein
MQLAQLSFTPGQGWSAPLPAALDGPDTLLLAFGAVHQPEPQAALQQLARGLPRSLLVGCTGAGLIVGDQVNDDALWVSVAAFERTTLRRVATELAGAADSRAAGQRLAAQLPTQGLRAVFVLSAGVDVHGAGLVQGLAGGLGDGVVHDRRPGRRRQTDLPTHLGAGRHTAAAWPAWRPSACTATACAWAMAAMAAGWTSAPSGASRAVAGNVLDELDGKPALDLYKTYLGELAAGAAGQSALRFPLSLPPARQRRPAAGAHHPGHRRGRAVAHLCRRHARGPCRAADAHQQSTA